jgi:hypothetical protein
MMTTLWQQLLGIPGHIDVWTEIPTEAIIVMLVLACCLCIAMLDKRIRAREVVRG